MTHNRLLTASLLRSLFLGSLIGGSLTTLSPAHAEGAYGPDTCQPGYVWRGVVPSDHVCVTPAERAQVVDDNRHAASRVSHLQPLGSRSDYCVQGYVWREAVPGDHVCVTPEQRDQVA